MTPSTDQSVILYDADCGFCTKSAKASQGRWFHSRVSVQSVQSADLDQWGIDQEDALRVMYAVRPDGTSVTGHLAWAELLAKSRLPWPAAAAILRIRPLSPLFSRLYDWVAANRDKLPGGTPACSLADRPQPRD